MFSRFSSVFPNGSDTFVETRAEPCLLQDLVEPARFDDVLGVLQHRGPQRRRGPHGCGDRVAVDLGRDAADELQHGFAFPDLCGSQDASATSVAAGTIEFTLLNLIK